MAITIGEIEQRNTYIYVKLTGFITRSDMSSVMQWCKDRECGKIVNNYAVSFKNADELTMFRLRWC